MKVDAHEWVQVKDGCKCVHCGLVHPMNDLPVGGCRIRFESKTSGFKGVE